VIPLDPNITIASSQIETASILRVAFTDQQAFPKSEVILTYKSSLHEDTYTETKTGTEGVKQTFYAKAADTFATPTKRYFKGWATDANRAGKGIIDYTVGEKISTATDKTLWAVWGYEYTV
jgi:hypothetical protein